MMGDPKGTDEANDFQNLSKGEVGIIAQWKRLPINEDQASESAEKSRTLSADFSESLKSSDFECEA